MENVSELEPKKHLINLARDRFSDEPVMGHSPGYHCPACDTVTRFQLGRKNPPTFTPTIQAALDSASGPAVPWEKDYTDFCCLGCDQPVRVAHAIHEFAMSPYRYLPLSIYVYGQGANNSLLQTHYVRL